MERFKKFLSGYYNATPPQTFSGDTEYDYPQGWENPMGGVGVTGSRLPHWSDDHERKPLDYWNSPKLWGNPKEEGSRFWNDPEYWESLPSKKIQKGLLDLVKDKDIFRTEKELNLYDWK